MARILISTFLLLLGTALAIIGARGAAANRRRYVSERGRPPLEGVPLDDRRLQQPLSTPKAWPATEHVHETREARAYAQLASERGTTRVMTGELLLLVAGAALGGAIPGATRLQFWPLLLAVGELLLGAVGLGLCERGKGHWRAVAQRYTTRADELADIC